ncbi:MAG: sensor histidine kinase, partial [Bacilli bacterium]
VSHDLKTPLSNIIGYADLLTGNDQPIVKTHAYAHIVYKNGVRANKLLTDLFDYALLESGEEPFERTRTHVSELVRTVVAHFLPEFQSRGCGLEWVIEDHLWVLLNERQMFRAVSNIMDNSLKYNTGPITLWVSVYKQESEVVIEIADNGIGIPEKMHAHIFDPFVRGDASRNAQKGGTGLGLSITKRIVEKHDGIITLNHRTDGGVRFVIHLPLA